MTKIIALTLALCLTAALHTSLQAKIHDYTEKDELGEFVLQGTITEYDKKEGKTLQVHNASTQKIYIRIGYISLSDDNCDFTGFILDPGQTGKIYKDPHCYPINITGTFINKDRTKIADIPHGIRSTFINDYGTLQWQIYDQVGIQYSGMWTGSRWQKQKEYARY